MRILLIAGTLSGLGGIETCIRTVAQEAEKRGDSIDILALCPSMTDGTWHTGLRYREIAKNSTSLSRQMIKGFPAILRELAFGKFDAVLTIYSSTVPAVRLALALLGKSVPVVAWIHFSPALKQRMSLLRYADGTLCISREIHEAVRAMPGVRPESSFLVFNGTDTQNVNPVPRSEDGILRILHIGRLMVGRQKRSDELLKALARVSGNWNLKIIGDGEDVPQLKDMARSLCIADRVSWEGWSQRPWALVHRADVLVLCSAFEGFGMVLVEALARGIPCISSDCPSGPSDIIENDRNGWLYPMNDSTALTHLLQRLIDSPQTLPPADQVKQTVVKFDSSAVYEQIRSALHRVGESQANSW